jgi:hypothetical protein
MAAQQERKGASPVSHTYLPLRQRNKRSLIAATGLLALAGVLGMTMLAGPAEAAKRKKRGVAVRVMTRNLYLGADLGPGLNAADYSELIDAGRVILNEVDTNDFPRRARALAAEIRNKRAHLVGLQEVALWRTGPADGGGPPITPAPPATTVRYDYLKLLMAQLNKGRKRYRIVKVQTEFEVETPIDTVETGDDNAEIDGKLTMRDVILARRGVKTFKPRGRNFTNLLNVNVIGFNLPVYRGWTSVEAKVRGKRFKFVNTHLEAFDDETQFPSIRALQAGEVVKKPARSRLPVILLGDFNSNVPGVKPGDQQAFQRILRARFKRRSTLRPPSCCTDPLTGNVAEFDHVVDHIVGKPGRRIRRVSSSVVGRAKVNGLFPSDHAGVFSVLRVR